MQQHRQTQEQASIERQGNWTQLPKLVNEQISNPSRLSFPPTLRPVLVPGLE